MNTTTHNPATLEIVAEARELRDAAEVESDGRGCALLAAAALVAGVVGIVAVGAGWLS